jgi:hypothetical protein
MDSKTHKHYDGRFLHSVLHILHDIFKLKKLGDLNQNKIKKLKVKSYKVAFNWLIREGKIYNKHNMEREFRIIFYIIHLLSLIKGDFFGPAQLSLMLTDNSNKQLLTTKLIQGTRFNRSQIKSLKLFVSKNFLSNHLAISIYKMLTSYLMKHKYKYLRKDYNSRFYDPDIIAEHLYLLIVEQMGFDCLILKPLEDSYRNPELGWIRHHIDEDVKSINPDKLALIQNNLHASSAHLPHMRDKGSSKKDVLRIRAKILYNRKTIRKLLFMDKKFILKEDLPKNFKKNFQSDSDINEFLYRRKMLTSIGESFFFDQLYGLYKNFFFSHKNELFWGTHDVNFK